MKKILVPTDFSPDASNAIKFAYLVAKQTGAKLSLLNVANFIVYDPNTPPEILAETISQTSDNAARGLEFQINEFKREYPDFDSYLEGKITSEGETASGIITAAEEGKFDLIIMGTKGASGIEEVLMGSNTYSVIAKSNIPVIAVPEKTEFKGFNNILYAIDLTSSEVAAIDELCKIVDMKKSDVTFLHLSDAMYDVISADERKIFDELKEKVKDLSCKFEFAKSDDVAHSLEDFVHKLNVDLLVISRKKRSFFEKLFHKSISKKLACHTDIPLLALQK